jgi:hypothetical protein
MHTCMLVAHIPRDIVRVSCVVREINVSLIAGNVVKLLQQSVHCVHAPDPRVRTQACHFLPERWRAYKQAQTTVRILLSSLLTHVHEYFITLFWLLRCCTEPCSYFVDVVCWELSIERLEFGYVYVLARLYTVGN